MSKGVKITQLPAGYARGYKENASCKIFNSEVLSPSPLKDIIVSQSINQWTWGHENRKKKNACKLRTKTTKP